MKERLRRLLLGYASGINPLAAFSQDAEMVGVDSEHVGSFIVVLQAEMLESYAEGLEFITKGASHHCLRERIDREGVRKGEVRFSPCLQKNPLLRKSALHERWLCKECWELK